MKKLFMLLASVLLIFGLTACGEATNQTGGTSETETLTEETEQSMEEATDESTEEATEEESNETYSVGDTVDIDGIKFTLKSVTTTDERNEFADTDPAIVVRIEYEVENNTDEEIAVGGDLEVYDGNGNKADLYPLENTMDTLQPGKKLQGVEHYGIETGPIEIYFQPLFSFGDPAVFEAEIE